MRPGISRRRRHARQLLRSAKLHLLVLATFSRQSGDVFIRTPVPSSSTAGLEAAYAAVLPAFCAQNGFGLIDIFNRWGGAKAYTTLNPLGWYADILHPSARGYADIGTAEAAAVLAP